MLHAKRPRNAYHPRWVHHTLDDSFQAATDLVSSESIIWMGALRCFYIEASSGFFCLHVSRKLKRLGDNVF